MPMMSLERERLGVCVLLTRNFTMCSFSIFQDFLSSLAFG